MTTRLQKYLHLAALILAAALIMSLTSCQQSYCPAYSYGYNQPKHKQTWNSNQKPKAAKKRTEHYAYKKKPTKAQEIWARITTVQEF